MRGLLLSFAALMLAAPAPAGDFDKYLPDNSQFFVHINLPKLFSSEMVRKAVPMVFDKYGDQIAGFYGMAKQFNPNAPDVPEDQIKDALKKAADPKVIAQAFDLAKDAVSDIVIAGNPKSDKPDVVVLIKSPFITAEGAEMIAGFAGATPQMKLDKIKKGNNTIYAMTVPQQPDAKVYLTIPQAGLLQISMSEGQAEASFAAKGKPGEALNKLMAKRGDKDFLFVAGLGDDGADYSSMAGSLVLDKDLSGTMNVLYKDEKKAAEQAKEATEKLNDMLDQLKGFLGDKADVLKPHLEKTKATADGNKVTATLSIPGSVVDKLLAKE